MNERIKELSKQAVDYASACEAEAWDGAYERKFAELIVKECAGISEQHNRNYYTSHGQIIADKIKEHFGVK